MKHALFIAFHYPPESSSSGVLRTLKFSRYLPEFGWRVTVITLREDAYEQVDPSLLAQLPPEIKVVRTRYLNSKRHFAIAGCYPALLAIPDRWIGWLPWALAAARRVMRDDPADLVFSTSPMATAHVIAGRVARRYRLPWVADFRDPWYEEPPEPGTPAVVHWAARRLERSVARHADRLLTTTEHMAEMLRTRYGALAQHKTRAIVNGYDEDDFRTFPTLPTQRGARLDIVHAGQINAEFRDPRPLFNALREAADAGWLALDEVHVTFIGGGGYAQDPELALAIAGLGLQDSISFAPRIPYDQALRRMAQADLLLLLQASEDTRQLVPAKFYEYLRLRRPVLALLFEGATSQLLQRAQAGWSVHPGQSATLARTLGDIVGLWKQQVLAARVADMDFLRQYDRRHLTGLLAGYFDKLTARGTP